MDVIFVTEDEIRELFMTVLADGSLELSVAERGEPLSKVTYSVTKAEAIGMAKALMDYVRKS